MRRAPNLDLNHHEIVGELRKLGYAVQDLAGMAGGVPDLIVSDACSMWLVEVKGEKGELTKDQKRWNRNWLDAGGKPPIILRSKQAVKEFDEAVKSCTIF